MYEKHLIEKLRQKYMKNPPEGMTSEMFKKMSDNDLLDMDYFLNEDFYDDDVGEAVYIKKQKSKNGYESEVTVYECKDCCGFL